MAHFRRYSWPRSGCTLAPMTAEATETTRSNYEPIQRLEIENYGCIRKASVTLTPLHALIGPNDSGKSTVLRALRTAAQFAGSDFGAEPNIKPVPFRPRLGDGSVVRLEYRH